MDRRITARISHPDRKSPRRRFRLMNLAVLVLVACCAWFGVGTARAALAYDYLFTFGSSGTGNGQFEEAVYDAIDGKGNVYVTVTAGASSLSYDATTNTYTYVWKTQKAWAGTCGTLHVTLTDGSDHTALFQFR